MKILGLFVVAAFAVAFSGCATTFTGSAHVDRQTCEEKCRTWGMELSGMVAMGEYSDACVCRVAGKSTASEDGFLKDSAAVAAGAAGVIMQERRNSDEGSHTVTLPIQ